MPTPRFPAIRLAASTLALAIAAGCSKEAPPPPPPAEVKVLKVEPRDTPITFEYIAQTQSPQQVNIVARVSGFLDRQLYTEGEIVKEGQILFQMDQKPFVAQLDAAQAAMDRAKAAHETALSNLQRVKPLAEQKRALGRRGRRRRGRRPRGPRPPGRAPRRRSRPPRRPGRARGHRTPSP